MTGIYEGTIHHRRCTPIEHSFRYRLFMVYLDLDDLPGALDGVPLWSARRPAVAWFRRADHFGDPALPLAEAVRRLVEERTGERPAGPVRLLTHLRYWGHCFNPVSFYYCFDADGEQLRALVAEVTNTPWGDRHCYVLPGGGGELDKALHVSPFMGMDHRYELHAPPPGEQLRVHVASRRDGELVFSADLRMSRREATAANLRRVLLRYPAMTMRVIAAIYLQAARLRLKGAPWFPRPAAAR